MTLEAANPEHEPDDYELVGSDNAWITVRDLRPSDLALSVRVQRTDAGVVVDIWPLHGELGDPIVTTYAFFDDALLEEP